jgi:hypothetical protein
MTREQNHLIKKLKTLSPDDVARVSQFVDQLRTGDRRMPVELRAVQTDGRPAAEKSAVIAEVRAAALDEASEAAFNQDEARSAEAEVARAACAQWRRRPFQAVQPDDMQPIAALFREAVDMRAASRFRFGSR